jgi:hypothetical protein
MKHGKRILSVLLAAMMLVSLLPMALADGTDSAVSADDIMVLNSIGHTSANTPASFNDATTRSATLEVPFSYSGTTLDLINGLTKTYDSAMYSNVVLAPKASTATIDPIGSVNSSHIVDIVVTFNKVSDTLATLYTTTYHLSVVRATKIDATFTGTITKTVAASNTLTLASTDFTSLYTQHDGTAMATVSFSGSNSTSGTLKSGGSNYDLVSSPKVSPSTVTFVAAATSGSVSYTVTAYGSDGVAVGSATLTINTTYQVPAVTGTVSTAVNVGSTLGFTSSTFSNSCNLYGLSLTSVNITSVTSNFGTWSYTGSSSTPSSSSPWAISVSDLSKLTYTATKAGTDTFTFTVTTAGGTSSSGSGIVTVSAVNLSLYSYTGSSTLTKGNTWTVLPSHFSSSSSTAIKYIKITSVPASTDGTLYLTTALTAGDATTTGYPAIAANTALTVNAIIPYEYISNLRLSSKSTSTSANISFSWTATCDTNTKTATWASTAATYTVKFDSAGTLYYGTNANIPVSFSSTDFNSAYTSATGKNLYYVTFTLPSATYGKLYYGYNYSTSTGTALASSTKCYLGTTPSLSSVVFVPTTNYTGSFTIAYSAYDAAGNYIPGELNISVSSCSGGTVLCTTNRNTPVQLDAADFSDSFKNWTGKELSFVRFSLPSSSYGTLYYDYTSPSDYGSSVYSSTNYYVYSSQYLSYVSFVPYTNYSGTVTIPYTAYDKNGYSYYGVLSIVITNDCPAGTVNYSCKTNSTVQLSGDDFANEFISQTGSVLSYVTFSSLASTYGVMYLDYSSSTGKGTSVSTSTKYYNGATPDLSNITFVAAKDYVGQLVLTYTVYTTDGKSYVGKMKINVGDGSAGSISYSTDKNTRFTLNPSDFISNFYSNTGGKSLSYVMFTLPSSSYGTLYYNYTSSGGYDSLVSAATRYNISGSPYLSKISFVPATGYSGSFTIYYNAYTADGTGFSGKIKVSVGSTSTLSVSYGVNSGSYLNFSTSDFSSAFYTSTGATLSYLQFSLPSVTKGTLYYGYSSSSSYTSAVSSSNYYYIYSYPYLSSVSFVPYSGATGSVTIPFTAFSTSGNGYSGTLTITINGTSAGTVAYSTYSDTPVSFKTTDFDSAIMAKTGSALNYVRFTLPSSSYGQLYYGYTSSSSYISQVSSSTSYYKSTSPLLSDVTFVPVKNYVGDVVIDYSATATNGTTYSGELTIHVMDSGSSAVSFDDVGSSYSWASDAISYLCRKGVVNGTSTGLFSPGNSVTRGDTILMLFRAFSFSGSTSGNFTDVPANSYYYNAIATAKSLGLIQGNNGLYYPDAAITRQDAMVILYKTLQSNGIALTAGSASDLSGFSDVSSVSDYAKTAVATLVKSSIITGSGGMLHPTDNISRAELSVILYRILLIYG